MKRAESVAVAVRRIAGEEMDTILSELGHASGKRRDEAIHETRKSVKKVRALLRLVRGELGGAYDQESQILRTAGQTLSELRDAGSMLEIAGKLQEKYKLKPAVMDPIRRGLLRQKSEAEKRPEVAAKLREITAGLQAARKRVNRWQVATDGFAALQKGLRSTLRQGRHAFAAAQKRPRAETYHEWRKRLKDHWYHVRLLESVWTEVMQGYEASLKAVESWLGDDHNLAILRERLLAEPERFGGAKSMAPAVEAIDQFQKELRGNAASMGERIYRDRPKRFVRAMRDLWNDWQSEPKSLDEFEKAERKKKRAA